jgi:apolipoprotein N-acyltransferase
VLKKDQRNRLAIAFAAGLLQAAAFPKLSLAGAAWVAPGMMVYACAGASNAVKFRTGYVAGIGFYLAALYWLLFIPVSFLPIVGWIALASFLALYPATWVWLCWKAFPSARGRQKANEQISESSSENISLPQRLRLSLFGLLARPAGPADSPSTESSLSRAEILLSISFGRRALWFMTSAALWVAMEMILARFLSGFPWNFLGASQYRMIPLTQISTVTGVYGVSFLVVWVSMAMGSALLLLSRSPLSKSRWVGELIPPALAIACVCFYGMRRIVHYEPSPRTIKAALIQPSIPQTLIWDEKENAYRFDQLLKLSEQALQENPQLVVWPEASVPNMLRYNKETAEAVIKLTTSHKVWLILGSDDAEPRPGTGEKEYDFFNSSFAVSPEGRIAGNYKKRRLVIFGEYIPFVKQLPFLKIFSPAGENGFTPGEKTAPFVLDNLKVKTSILICFEDTFPHLVPEYAQEDVDFLLNLTNNGWFGESAAQWQHAAMAVFRAIENNIPLIRCANNGLTCWVDELGRMHNAYFADSNDVYKPGYKIVEVPILTNGYTRTRTFYNQHGDLFGWTCMGGGFLAAMLGRIRRSRRAA